MSNLLPVIDVSTAAPRPSLLHTADTRTRSSEVDAERVASMFKALGDPVRLRLFSQHRLVR